MNRNFVHQCTRSHATYVIVYVPMNFPSQFCVPPVHKISCDLCYNNNNNNNNNIQMFIQATLNPKGLLKKKILI